jgi:hypothetical protein
MLFPIQESMNVNDQSRKSRFGELPEAEEFGQHLALVITNLAFQIMVLSKCV